MQESMVSLINCNSVLKPWRRKSLAIHGFGLWRLVLDLFLWIFLVAPIQRTDHLFVFFFFFVFFCSSTKILSTNHRFHHMCRKGERTKETLTLDNEPQTSVQRVTYFFPTNIKFFFTIFKNIFQDNTYRCFSAISSNRSEKECWSCSRSVWRNACYAQLFIWNPVRLTIYLYWARYRSYGFFFPTRSLLFYGSIHSSSFTSTISSSYTFTSRQRNTSSST